MKKSKFKNAAALIVLIVMLAVAVVPSVIAVDADWGCSYSIPTGSDHWNGWNEGARWKVTVNTECRYNVSILSSQTVQVHGSIFKYVPLFQDQWIAQVRFSGANGTWQGRLFIPELNKTYYSRITEETKTGVYGRTSITIMP